MESLLRSANWTDIHRNRVHFRTRHSPDALYWGGLRKSYSRRRPGRFWLVVFSLAPDESCDGCDSIQLLIYRLSNQGAGSHKLTGVTTETGVTYRSELNCFSSLHQRERIKSQTICCTFGGKWDWRCDISYHWGPESAGRKWHARAFRWRPGRPQISSGCDGTNEATQCQTAVQGRFVQCSEAYHVKVEASLKPGEGQQSDPVGTHNQPITSTCTKAR